jgi:hypothetical protein
MRAVKVLAFASTQLYGIDTLETVTQARAIALVSRGVSFRIGYIDAVGRQEIADGQSVGLGFMPCTYAMQSNGPHTVARLLALGLPQGITAWLDVEGTSLDGPTITMAINAWAKSVQLAGFVAGLYVGAGCPLTPDELEALAVTRYWASCSEAPLPARRGPCMIQLRPPDVLLAGTLVDVDVVQPDWLGDVPMMAVS